MSPLGNSPPERGLVAKQHERDGGGAIVTYGDGVGVVVRVFTGNPFSEAMGEAAVFCRALGPEWRILSISTPVSVWWDLHGREPYRSGSWSCPEARMMPTKDHDVLAPHLVSGTRQSAANRRAKGIR